VSTGGSEAGSASLVGNERRAPTIASCRIPLQSAGFSNNVGRLEEGLEKLDEQDRRQVRVLVARLAAQWIGEQGPSHRTLVGEVAMNGSMLRVDVYSDPPIDDPVLWEELAVPLARDSQPRSWAIDRRRSSGVWFELR
jgi:hypothetical protein